TGRAARAAPDALIPPGACRIDPRTELDKERHLGGSISDSVYDDFEVEDLTVGFAALSDRQRLPQPPRPDDLPIERGPVNGTVQSEDIHVLRTSPVISVLASWVAGQDPKQIVETLTLEIIKHVLPYSAVAIRRASPPERAGEIVNRSPEHDDAVFLKVLQPGDGLVK